MQTPSSVTAHGAILDPAAKAKRRNKVIYWTLTLLMFVPGTIGAFAEAFTNGPASIVKIMLALGYPLYLMKILGTFKIFGGIAILTGKLPRMKEWAYAGFFHRVSWSYGFTRHYGRCEVFSVSALVLRGLGYRVFPVA